MSKEIVISAYDKDLSWLNKFNQDIKKTVYRKGVKTSNENEIFIEPNIGRDIHVFFNHIYVNYYDLSDYTFFVQDYPFDHWENLIDVINGDVNSFNTNAALNFDGYWGFHYNSIGTMWNMPVSQQFGSGKVLACNSDGTPQDLNPNIDVDKFWDVLFESPKPHMYEFMPGGHFGISKEQAWIRSRNFYEKIINLLLEDKEDKCIPWVIERLECYMFNKNYKTKL